MSVNKTELIQTVVEKTGATKKQATEILEATLDTVTEQLAAGDSVVLVGFGTFSVKARAARKGINPQTREEILIKASNSPSFKAGKVLKDSIIPTEVSGVSVSKRLWDFSRYHSCTIAIANTRGKHNNKSSVSK